MVSGPRDKTRVLNEETDLDVPFTGFVRMHTVRCGNSSAQNYPKHRGSIHIQTVNSAPFVGAEPGNLGRVTQ